MDSYVVRIYRRVGRKSRILIGTAEVAGTEKKMGFSNIEELWEILRRRKRQAEPEKPHPPEPNECPVSLDVGTRQKEESIGSDQPDRGFLMA